MSKHKRSRKHSIKTGGKNKKRTYPEYCVFDPSLTSQENLEQCWKKYADRVEELQETDIDFTYPLNENSVWFYSQHYGFHKAMIVHVSPEKFLKLAVPKYHVRKSSLDYLFDAFEGFHQIDPLYLRVDAHDCKVIGHEGRHRAEIARDLGIKHVPVIVDYAPSYTLNDVDSRKTVLYEQEFAEYLEGKEISESFYKKALRMFGDKWKCPEGCTINKMKPEEVGTFSMGKQVSTIEEVRKMREAYRKKYGLE